MTLKALLLVLMGAPGAVYADVSYNVVNLDNRTLPFLCGWDLPCFVRFDRDYSFGAQHKEFEELAVSAAKADAEILIGNIPVYMFEPKINQDLAASFGVHSGPITQEIYFEKFPRFFLFKARNPVPSGKHVPYNGEVTKKAMLSWLRDNADIKTGADKLFSELEMGSNLQRFHDLANSFMTAADSDVKKIIKKAEKELKKFDKDDPEREEAEEFVSTMKKIKKKGNEWAKTEHERLLSMILKSANNPEMWLGLTKRASVLQTFTKGVSGVGRASEL